MSTKTVIDAASPVADEQLIALGRQKLTDGSDGEMLEFAHAVIAEFLESTGRYVTNDASRDAALNDAYAEGRKDEREANGWQPIETAPKDGSGILLGFNDEEIGGFVGQGRWHEEDHDGPDNMGHDAGFMDDQYQFFRCARSMGNPDYQHKGLQPTHWMPLPEAPAGGGL